MVVKNIVNIQNNKLDFDINGTNQLRFIFRGTENFRLTEVGGTNEAGGTNHIQFIAQKAAGLLFEPTVDGTNADFIGRISNINNHVISNLKNVDATNAVADEVLVYDGTNWINKQSSAIGAEKLKYGADDGTSVLNLLTDTFNIIGTESEIETTLISTSTSIRIGLPTSVIISNELIVGGTGVGGAFISGSANGDAKIVNTIGNNNEGITIGTNGNVTIDSNNFIVNSDTTINGNLIVNGTQTTINSEIKLIEDPLIELGYAGTNSLPVDQDIGFFGQYTNNNYAGLYYDVSHEAFRVFDSLGTNDYETSLGTNPNGNIVTTNSRAANIVAKNFITSSGHFGQDVFGTSFLKVFGSTQTVLIDVINVLQNQDVYGTGNGIFSGKLLSYIHHNDFSASASSLINYSLHIGGTNPTDIVLASSVELETKVGVVDFIDFNSDNNNIDASLGTNAAAGIWKFGIRLLPIFSTNLS